ncbi:MAG: NAD-dependent epimerase/dehydratase [Elusimicrobiota bacterium]
MNYKILVTGGAGYIGSMLVPRLLELGNKVTVIDNFMYSPNSLAECCNNKNFDVIRGDARSEKLMKSLVKDKDVIIPLAALVGAPLCDRDTVGAVTINYEAVKMVTKITSKAQRIIYPTTNSGYGIGKKGKFCTETTPLNPISLYGRTKVDAEKAVLDRGNTLTFRLATVFGMSPRMRIDLMVNDFVYRAVTDRFIVLFEAHFKRNFIHIRDVVRAFVHAIENFDDMKNKPYNVGLSDANLSKLELCDKIKEYIPGFTVLEAAVGEDVDKRDYIVSNKRIEATGYKPEHSLDDGIQELIKGYRIIRNFRYGNVG